MSASKPSFAGAFYPSPAEELAGVVDSFIMAAGEPSGRPVLGVISPHAGYVYSGAVAGYSFRELKNSSAERVVVLAPSHRVPLAGAAVFARGFYPTPLGDVPVDEEVCVALLGNELFAENYDVHKGEHSLEVQVPFLQRVIPDARIIPLIIGTVDPGRCADIAGSIFKAVESAGGKTMVVVSTDLSHYHPYNEAVEIDKRFIDTLKKFDASALSKLLRSRGAEACGEGPLLTALPLMKMMGAESIEILCYKNSGDTAGDRSQVVGYLSAAFV